MAVLRSTCLARAWRSFLLGLPSASLAFKRKWAMERLQERRGEEGGEKRKRYDSRRRWITTDSLSAIIVWEERIAINLRSRVDQVYTAAGTTAPWLTAPALSANSRQRFRLYKRRRRTRRLYPRTVFRENWIGMTHVVRQISEKLLDTSG